MCDGEVPARTSSSGASLGLACRHAMFHSPSWPTSALGRPLASESADAPVAAACSRFEQPAIRRIAAARAWFRRARILASGAECATPVSPLPSAGAALRSLPPQGGSAMIESSTISTRKPQMDAVTKEMLWHQLGATIDMLENAVDACPDERWGDRTRETPFQFWYLVFHTLFWLDLDLNGTLEGFAPPAPFTLDEMDPAGAYPDRVYSKAE